jgi:predicted unusual protein kinase regulating ubiquinone biosynthesis (AarF/ABC1/UbiB family)
METSARASSPVEADRALVDRRRYWRILWFCTGILSSLLWWDLLVPSLLGRGMARRSRPNRFRLYARRFRTLAVELGGVLIKLGQFFSARVDVLPPEITSELAGLQDEVPPAPFKEVRALLIREIGALEMHFSSFDDNASAAASLGQIYRARLETGERVVVKVQRPDVATLVATDLAALEVVSKWLMRYGPIRRRANVPALLDEFSRTLWEELDYEMEAANAERFARMFAEDFGVYVPAVYAELSTRRVLTLEDVTSIKIADTAALDAAGVDRRLVGARLFQLYMTQIFEHRFFHADPHPGNLFVYPWPEDGGSDEPRRFYIVFVDFGMVGRVSDHVRRGLREALIAVGTRDIRRLVGAYQSLGVLLPGADVGRIVEAERKVFDRVWGLSMREMVAIGYEEMSELASEFKDLLYDLPFQIPNDLMYLGRAVGMLSGMCTRLDPEFNPWASLAPHVRRLADEERRSGAIYGELLRWVRQLVAVPPQAMAVLDRAERGELEVRIAGGDAGTRERGGRALRLVAWAIVVAGFSTGGAYLYVSGERSLGTALLTLSLTSLLGFVVQSVRGR